MELQLWTTPKYILVSHLIQMGQWSNIFLMTSIQYTDSIIEGKIDVGERLIDRWIPADLRPKFTHTLVAEGFGAGTWNSTDVEGCQCYGM
jgi:hypothetical protein